MDGVASLGGDGLQTAKNGERRTPDAEPGTLTVRRPHTGFVNELLHGTVDLAAGSSMGGMDVHRFPIELFRARRRQGYFVLHRLIMIGDLELRVVNAIKL